MTSKTAFQDAECYGFQKHFKHMCEWLYKEWSKRKPLDIVGSNEHIFLAPDDRLVQSITVMLIFGREKPQSLERKVFPTVALFTTDLTWTTLGLNPGTPYLTHCHLCTLDPHWLPQDWIQAYISAPAATLSTPDPTWITPGLSVTKQLIEIWHGTTAHSYWF